MAFCKEKQEFLNAIKGVIKGDTPTFDPDEVGRIFTKIKSATQKELIVPYSLVTECLRPEITLSKYDVIRIKEQNKLGGAHFAIVITQEEDLLWVFPITTDYTWGNCMKIERSRVFVGNIQIALIPVKTGKDYYQFYMPYDCREEVDEAIEMAKLYYKDLLYKNEE